MLNVTWPAAGISGLVGTGALQKLYCALATAASPLQNPLCAASLLTLPTADAAAVEVPIAQSRQQQHAV